MRNDSGINEEEEFLEDQLEHALELAEFERESKRDEEAIKQLENLE